MKENQNIEWKESWRDEYLKWITGFANANGGTLYIGKNDKGKVIGLENASKLLDDIPNKVRDILGILVEVNLLQENGKEFLEIKVDPYPSPINYKGEYYYRSGSTKQELKGAALNKFLLQKSGKHWDGILIPNFNFTDLSSNAIERFKKLAKKSKRVSEGILEESLPQLLENLNLIEDNQFKRACTLLFYDNPEKFVTGSYIKIGFFESDADLLYQDEIHGNLFEQIEKIMDLLLTKYMNATIRYEGISRIEEYPYPEAALREAILNAIAHKDYDSGIPIQISVYKEKLHIWNEGDLPSNWTLETILSKHPSKPANPNIANTFFRSGMIESWGRGVSKIITECEKANLPTPHYSTEFGGLMITFLSEKNYAILDQPVKKLEENWKSFEKSEKSMVETEKSMVETEKSMVETEKSMVETEKSMVETEKSMVETEKSMEKIMNLIRENAFITNVEMAEKIGITKNAIEKNISKLKNKGRLIRIGSNKGGHWQIKEN